MLRQWSVAGFAVHVCMLAFAFYIRYFRVACLARLVSGISYWKSPDLCDRVRAIMTISTEALRNNVPSNYEEDNECENEKTRESKQMACIFETHCSRISLHAAGIEVARKPPHVIQIMFGAKFGC